VEVTAGYRFFNASFLMHFDSRDGSATSFCEDRPDPRLPLHWLDFCAFEFPARPGVPFPNTRRQILLGDRDKPERGVKPGKVADSVHKLVVVMAGLDEGADREARETVAAEIGGREDPVHFHPTGMPAAAGNRDKSAVMEDTEDPVDRGIAGGVVIVTPDLIGKDKLG
jgi:hypothetical protein